MNLCYDCERKVEHECLNKIRIAVDDAHRRIDNILELNRNKFKAITQDICKLIDELREHKKLPHSMPLYGRRWIDKSPDNATHAIDAASYIECQHDWQLTTELEDMKYSWTQVCLKCKAVKGVDMAESKENPSRKVLEKKLHDKNLRILQLEAINSANKKRIEDLECALKVKEIEVSRLNKHICKQDDKLALHNRGCCL